MKKTTGLFLDVNNIYYNVKLKHNKKVDYKKYLAYINDFGTVDPKIAYCVNNPVFANSLKNYGFVVNYKPTIQLTQNALMTFDILRYYKQCDKIILGTNSTELNFLIDFLTKEGIKVIILAAKIKNKKDNMIEIPPSILL